MDRMLHRVRWVWNLWLCHDCCIQLSNICGHRLLNPTANRDSSLVTAAFTTGQMGLRRGGAVFRLVAKVAKLQWVFVSALCLGRDNGCHWWND